MNVKLKKVFSSVLSNREFLLLISSSELFNEIPIVTYVREFRVHIEVQSRTFVRDFFLFSLWVFADFHAITSQNVLRASLTREYDVTYPSPAQAQYFHYFTFIRSYYFTYKYK